MAIKTHWPKILIAALLGVILAVPFALRPSQARRPITPGDTLIIFTPNNEQIRDEFSRGFNRYRRSHHLPPVRFDWRASGGTSDLLKQVLSELLAKARVGAEAQGVGGDLFFGGGAYNHDLLARGVTVTRHGEKVRISASVPPQLPPGLLQTVFPQPTIAGQPLYDPHGYWLGTALSSFGIIYNRDLLHMLHLPEPRTWADLDNPAYLGWIGLADPAHSGAIAATYNVILQREGWNRGWALLRRIFANARSFTASSSKVPVDVASGEAAAGMCIDFYGRFETGAIGRRRIGYVDPPGMTAVTADPISLLRGAPHKKLATDFIIWVLSKPAQRLWQRRVGTPGGPRQFELRRQPIRRDLYTPAEKRFWTDPRIDPFKTARPLPDGTPDFFRLVAPITHAMAIDIHDDLTAAWSTIIHTPVDDPRRPAMLAAFYAMPHDLSLTWPADLVGHWRHALADKRRPDHRRAVNVLDHFWHHLTARYHGPRGRDRLLRDRMRWTDFFRAHYRQVIELGKRP